LQSLSKIKSAFLFALAFYSLQLCQAQKIYSIWEDPSSVYRFVSIDGSTGTKTNINTINNLLGYISPGTSTINTKTREYIFRGLTSMGGNYIYSIDLVSGNINSQVTLPQNIIGLEYNYVTDTTYGLWEDSSGVYQVVWIDPKSGSYKRIGAVTGVSAYVGGTFSVDTKDSLYQFMGLDNSKYYLYAVHIKTGRVVYKNQVSRKIHAIRYNCNNDSLYGRLDSNNRYNLVAINAASGGYSVIDSMVGISSGYISDAFVLNEDSASYIFLGFQRSSTKLIKVRQNNAQVVSSPSFTYRRLAGFETVNCAVPLPKPKAIFTANYSDSICVGDSVFFSDISTGNPRIRNWTFNGGKPFNSGDSSLFVVYDTIGRFNVRLSVTNSSGTDDSLAIGYIKVSPCGVVPTAKFQSNYSDTLCEGDTLTFTDLSTGKPTNRQWTFFGATPLTSSDSIVKVVYNTAGNYDIRLSVSNSLGRNDSLSPKFIFVKKCGLPPVSIFKSSYTDTICQGDTIRFTDISQGMVSGRQWNFPGGKPGTSTDSIVNVVYDTVGSFNWTLSVSNAFGNDDSTSSKNIEVKSCSTNPDKPIAKIYSSVSGTICENDTVLYKDTSSGNPTQWLWSFPGGSPASSTSKNVSVVYSSSGTFDVTLRVTNSTGSDDTTQSNWIKVIPCENKLVEYSGKREVQFYPNPFNRSLGISWGTTHRVAMLKVMDLNGRVMFTKNVHTQNRNNIEIEGCNSGLYVIQIFWTDGTISLHKIVHE
tara:strand:- start:1093 stop:3354 length:2262 start_codon:yes stop_codon:yes gene_type:complete